MPVLVACCRAVVHAVCRWWKTRVVNWLSNEAIKFLRQYTGECLLWFLVDARTTAPVQWVLEYEHIGIGYTMKLGKIVSFNRLCKWRRRNSSLKSLGGTNNASSVLQVCLSGVASCLERRIGGLDNTYNFDKNCKVTLLCNVSSRTKHDPPYQAAYLCVDDDSTETYDAISRWTNTLQASPTILINDVRPAFLACLPLL